MRVLFVYPNGDGRVTTELRIPLAISILISVMRKAGHTVKLFDTTFMGEFHSDNEAMVKLGTHKDTNLNELVGNTTTVCIKDALLSLICKFKPDFILASVVERNFKTCKDLLKGIDIPVLLGGILPTIAPDFILSQDWVDYICVGEGENLILDFLSNPHNLKSQQLINLDYIPEQDWSDFDQRHLLKPFMGKVYRGGAFEFSRGCFKSCTFCVAPSIRKAMAGCGQYHRTKTPTLAIDEIEDKVREYDLEMVAFGDTDFLAGVPKSTMMKFLAEYDERIGLPFTIQASVGRLLDEEILILLRKAGCCAVSVGIESGSPRIQRDVLKKVLFPDKVKKAFDLCRKHDIRVTANYMIGLPYETEKDVYETIKFNRLINPPSIAVTFFTPFMGTELYDICVKEGFYKPFEENVYEYPPLSMPQLSQERIKELVGEFTGDFKTYQEDFSVL